MGKIAAILLYTALTLQAQPAFEAASIKRSPSGAAGGGLNLSTARIRIVNSSLNFCIQAAFNVKDFQVTGGPGWAETERYNIEAVAAEPFKKGEFRSMLQALLADRFGLAIHREMQDRNGYFLVAAKNGPKLPAGQDDPDVMFSHTASGDTTLTAKGANLSQLAMALSSSLGSTVIDKTGIAGNFDLSLQWTPDPSSRTLVDKQGRPLPPPPSDATPGPSIFTALQEKLGLKLEAAKVPVEVIVIDRATKPTEN